METSNSCFIKGKDLVTRSIAGETIIVPIKNNVGDLDSVYTLNEIGTLIWELIDGKKSLDQIIEAIYSAYEVTPEEVTKDMVDFVSSLKEAGLIRPIGESKERPSEP
jgi:hypothetical protein